MHEIVIVLGGGWSVTQFNLRDLEKRGTLIAVNESAVFTKPEYVVTMDRLWSEYRYPLLLNQGCPNIYLREGIAKNFTPRADTIQFKHGGKAVSMSKVPGCLNGQNSGACALNLAYQLSTSRVYLLGFDMRRGPKDEPYWHQPYPWNPDGATHNRRFAEWSNDFEIMQEQFAKDGLKVFNVNYRSAIKAFPTLTFDEFLKHTHD